MKKYYVGIDYHKRYSVASAVDEEGRREAEGRSRGSKRGQAWLFGVDII